MAIYDNSYSRVVAWLKVLLPVMALILLSVMFLISRTIDPTQALTYADVDIDELLREQQITRPSFSAVTQDGAAITFTAAQARPDPDTPANYTATDLSAQIETPDGAVVDILARQASVDGAENRLDLTGGVSLQTSTDYRIEGEGLRAWLDATRVESIGPVTATAPAGAVEAGQVTLTRIGDEVGTYLLVFKNGVKLVYDPKPQEDR